MLVVLGSKNESIAFLKYHAFYFTTTRFENARVERSINIGFPHHWNLTSSITQRNEKIERDINKGFAYFTEEHLQVILISLTETQRLDKALSAIVTWPKVAGYFC